MSRAADQEEGPKIGTPWFWWCAAIVLAACGAIWSWSSILHLFTFPDRGDNYALLEKYDRLPEVAEISANAAPEGEESLNVLELHGKLLAMAPSDVDDLNRLLKRQILGAFEDDDLIYYIEGNFEVLEVRDLTEDDFVPEGLAVKAKATIKVDEFRPASSYPLYLELILPGAKAAQKIFYQAGGKLELRRVPAYVTLLHGGVRTVDGERAAVVTGVPIVKGRQIAADEKGSRISVALPRKYNVGGAFPLFSYE